MKSATSEIPVRVDERPARAGPIMNLRQRLPSVVILTAGPLILFGPMLVQGEVLYWGTPMLQFVPWRELAFRLVSRGHLPLWDPLLGMGAPLLANYQSALLYPPNLLLVLTGPAWGHGLLVALHLIWAAWGMAQLAKKLGMGELAQVIAGVSYSLSGYMVARAGFLTINAAAAWLPWLVLAAEGLIESASLGERWSSMRPSIVILSLGLTFQWLAGHAQTAWYSLIFVLSWLLWRVLQKREERSLVRALVGVSAAGLFAFALAAVQLMPALEYLANSQRGAAVGREFALTYSFWPWRLIGLLAPNMFGNPAAGDYWGYGNFWEDAIYIGVLPVVLAIAGLIREMRRSRRHSGLVRMLGAFGAVAFVFALGKNTPAFPFLFDHVPTFDLFQAPTRWNLILVFCLALLASVGVDGWTRPGGRGLYWSRLATVGAGVIMLASPIGLYLLKGVEPTFVRGLAWAGGLLCMTGILSLAHPIDESPRWLLLVGGFVLLDLTLTGAGLNPSINASALRSQGDVAELAADHRSYMTPEAEYKLKFNEAFPFTSFRSNISLEALLDLGIPNTLVYRGQSSANNFDPILPERYAVLVGALEGLETDEQQAILRLMDVSSIVSLDTNGRLQHATVEGPRRIRVVGREIWVAGGQDALARVLDPGFRPDELVVLEGSRDIRAGSAVGEATVLSGENPNSVVVHVSSEGEAWVVLSDIWYPGWRALVDDREVEIYRADYLFRAVNVPGGDHVVRFEYSPSAFWAGLGLSAIAWLLLMGVVWRQRRV